MPVVVVMTSSAMSALPGSLSGDNGLGTRWFHGVAAASAPAKNGQILRFRLVFGSVCLDSLPLAAISPLHSGAGFLAPLVFALNLPPNLQRIARKVPITTEQKAGPDFRSRPGPNTKELNDVRSHQNRR